MTATAKKPALWTPGDWNAFFGFGTNILVNMLVLTTLLRFVLKMPDSIVFGRILPALGLMMCLSTLYYAWLAYRLAEKTGRSDVCALPSGVSVPHMFVVTFVIMLPIGLKTGDPIKAWEAGIVWVFFQSFILMAGGFIAPYIRRITPRAALLGTLAGVSITFISMRPALEMYQTPQIGIVCFAIILLSWFGGVKIRRTMLLTVEGEKDDVCAVAQTVAAHDLCSKLRPYLKRHHMQPGVGHYGVFSGKRWESQIYPLVKNVILASD